MLVTKRVQTENMVIISSAQLTSTVFRVFPWASHNSPIYIPLTSCHGGLRFDPIYEGFVVVRNGSHFQMAKNVSLEVQETTMFF